MSDPRRKLIKEIHAAPDQTVLAVTGGGSLAISDLLSTPGASATVLEAVVPYAFDALTGWLGHSPEQACGRESALAMAVVAFERSTKLAGRSPESPDGDEAPAECGRQPEVGAQPPLIGVGCTASLASNRPKSGDHRCWVATQTQTTTCLYSLTLTKGARERQQEERIVGDVILQSLAKACDIATPLAIDLIGDESVLVEEIRGDRSIVELWTGRRSLVWSMPDGKLQIETDIEIDQRPGGVLSGSFNPRHTGHSELRDAAERHLGRPVCFELAIHNVDKPPLDFITIEQRRRQFDDVPLALTSAPTFAEKAESLPNTVFIVGVDTAERIVLPRYYASEEHMHAALVRFRELSCRFLVAGRQVDDGFLTLSDLAIPDEFVDLFEELSEAEFRADVSSTDLRQTADRTMPNRFEKQ